MSDINENYRELIGISGEMNGILAKAASCLPDGLLSSVSKETSFGQSDALRWALEVLSGDDCRSRVKRDEIAQFGYFLGRYQELTADPRGAELTYEKVLRFAPTHLLTARALAALRIEQGNQAGALSALDGLLASVDPKASDLQRAEALTKRAEVLMWERKFDDAKKDLERAKTLMPDAESGTDGPNIALGSLLNLSACLEMQVGNYRAAAENARRAFQVFAMGDSARAQVTALTNLVSILTVSGEIKEAHRYADEADSRIGKLAELDRQLLHP